MIPKEPTLLERLEVEHKGYRKSGIESPLWEAIIELYRDYLKRQGKE